MILSQGISRIRNRVIARVFQKVQLMEEWGNGYSRITQACQQNGCPEPLWEEYGTTIRVTLFPRRETPIIVELASEESLIERHNALLKLLKEKPLSFHEIYAHFPGTSERTIRYDLSYLKEMKYVQSKGIGRATVWQLTKNQPEQ